jgi:ribosomal protein L37AE/L43A
MSDWKECQLCGDDVHVERWALGYHYCKNCGDTIAREARKHWTVAPMNKSNYMLFTDISLLKQLNPKRTT